jgi:hypothetical protein
VPAVLLSFIGLSWVFEYSTNININLSVGCRIVDPRQTGPFMTTRCFAGKHSHARMKPLPLVGALIWQAASLRPLQVHTVMNTPEQQAATAVTQALAPAASVGEWPLHVT